MFLTELFPQKLNRIALFSFFNYTVFSSNTGTAITVFDVIAVLFSSLAISIVDKILYYLKVRPAQYCAYCYLTHY